MGVLTLLNSQLDEMAQLPTTNKLVRFVYTMFDEIFARTVEEEQEMIFVVRSVTIQLQSNIRPVRTAIMTILRFAFTSY